jgi:hypothetical protein
MPEWPLPRVSTVAEPWVAFWLTMPVPKPLRAR